MTGLREFFSNRLFLAVASAFLLSQIIKTILHIITKKTFDPERLYGSGGMPSAHSATVTTLALCSGVMYGFDSFQFAISAVLASIVIYDARGVRREAGKHAVLLNQIMDIFDPETRNKISFEEHLNEFIGHSGWQIIMGMLLGVGITVFYSLIGFITKV